MGSLCEERRKHSATKKYRQCGGRISQSAFEATRTMTHDIGNEAQGLAIESIVIAVQKKLGHRRVQTLISSMNVVSLTNDENTLRQNSSCTSRYPQFLWITLWMADDVSSKRV
jgi:hypothetical protein